MNARADAVFCVLLTLLFSGLSGCGSNEDSLPADNSYPMPDTEPGGDTSTRPGDSGGPLVWLDQNWSREQSQEFYFTDQGSELVPFDWFMALEQANSSELFRADDHMTALGFISQAASPGINNRHALPIGLVFRDHPENAGIIRSIKSSAYGQQYDEQDYPRTTRWLGLTCAACHTADITYGGSTIRIDGAPAMIDHESFLAELVAALRVTCDDEAKFERFEHGIREFRKFDLDGGGETDDLTTLRSELEAFTSHMERLVAMNAGTHPYGFARLDAFGAILNEVTASGLGVAENQRPSDAPVSFPHLWYAPHLDFVQWNRSADNALARNVGEVLGVYAHFQLINTPDESFRSTINFDGLIHLEELLRTLEAPAWPEQILGAIDHEKAERGRKLFAENCQTCHVVRSEEGKDFPRTAEGLIVTQKTPVSEIGTDPRMAVNFLMRTTRPGPIKPLLPSEYQNLEEVPAGIVLRTAVQGIIQRFAAENGQTLADLIRLGGNHPPRPLEYIPDGYIARPLAGIWATAPYFHNGSVPNLYETLLPEQERSKSFYVGSREFDPKHVGFVTTQDADRAFLFETADEDGKPVPGNMNVGHSGPFKTQTRDEGGEWRDFSEDERWALVEYMKTLK